MTTLSERALLVSLSIQSWSARKFDRQETADLAKHHGTPEAVARVNKALLPNSEKLKAVEKAAGAARQEFYQRTLPWMHSGVAIVRTEGYFDFTEAMRQRKEAFETCVRSFLLDYPTLREQARHVLNGLYKAEDYPPAHELRSKFRFDIGFMPLPDETDWRIELEGEELERLKTSLRASMAETEHSAMQVAWQRVYDVASKSFERLSNVDNIFRDSLVENALSLCSILPSLNLTGDPKLEEMRTKMERAFAGVTPTQLREDVVKREQVATAMDDIMKKMAGLYAPREA